jgi:hypothetical protein
VDVTPLKAISIRQPWAMAIIYGDKDIENRSRRTTHRGPTLIHASAGMRQSEVDDFVTFVKARKLVRWAEGVQASEIVRGGIIGIVDVLDCVDSSDSPWWMGPRGYVVANPRPLPFVPCRGTITPLFWTPDHAVQLTVARALAEVAR